MYAVSILTANSNIRIETCMLSVVIWHTAMQILTYVCCQYTYCKQQYKNRSMYAVNCHTAYSNANIDICIAVSILTANSNIKIETCMLWVVIRHTAMQISTYVCCQSTYCTQQYKNRNMYAVSCHTHTAMQILTHLCCQYTYCTQQYKNRNMYAVSCHTAYSNANIDASMLSVYLLQTAI